jgi:predicted acyl esterase
LYQKSSNDDLQKFFDKYLLRKDNGWEKTPTVRHSLLGYNVPCVINRPDVAYPPPSINPTTLYVSCASGTLQTSPGGHNSTTQYQSNSWDDDGVHFSYKFSSYTELIGYSRVILYMSCADTDEMDVYVIIRKLDAHGNELLHINIPLEDLPVGVKETDVPHGNIFKYVGPNGRLRASKRKFLEHEPGLTPEQSKTLYPAEIWHPLEVEEKITPGEIVRLEIPLWPSGIIFQSGESMRLEVKGHEVTLPEFPALDRVPTNLNRGMHVIHSGPEYPSSLIVPLSQGAAADQ